MRTALSELVFLGFNSRAVALNRNTGDIVWEWKAPQGWAYVSLLLINQEQLIVSVSGYTYSLDPLTGEQHWFNELKGFGSGVTSIVALDSSNPHDPLVAAASADAASHSAG